jgi:hypothetical protein
MTGWGLNNSPVGSGVLHFPHLGPALILDAGILFLAPQPLQRILYAVCSSPVDSSLPHLPHFAGVPILSAGIRLPAPQDAQRTIVVLV